MAKRGRHRRGRSKPKRERRVELERYRSFVDDWSAFTAAAGRPEPTVLRVQTARIEPEALRARLTARGFELRPLEGMAGFYQVEREPVPVSMTLEHWLGLCYVQQASTGVAAPALGPRPGERVLDLCAAPGGKTTHICELMDDRGCVVASEISESRIRGLLGNVYRLGHPGVLVVAADGRTFPGGALFDRVLVDAPCSGEGTLRRRAGSAPDQSASFVDYVTRAQRGLLKRAVELTKPGGTILYVTCTFAPEENEAVVSEALDRLPVELDWLELPVPHARGLTDFEGTRYDPRLEGAARIYPHHLDSGGLFLARLRRLEGEGAVDGDAGWSAVPPLFPEPGATAAVAAPDERGPSGTDPDERGGEVGPALAHETASAADLEMLHAGIEEVWSRFAPSVDVDELGWTLRGGRAWMHTIDAWPLASWTPDRWRAISVGLRAIDFDSRGRPRPTNDFLRWARPRTRTVALSEPDLDRLLEREPTPTVIEERGPIALAYEEDVIGRGAVTGEGLKSEIPKARAADLKRLRARS